MNAMPTADLESFFEDESESEQWVERILEVNRVTTVGQPLSLT